MVIVGVLFGMGSSFDVIMHPQRSNHGVDARELLDYTQRVVRIDRDLHIPDDPRMIQDDQASQRIRISWMAEDAGLMPKGQALDDLVDDFLNAPANPRDPSSRTRRDLLAEAVGGPNEVTREDLRRYLAPESAIHAYVMRQVVVPAVPQAVSDDVAVSIGDKVEAVEVQLDAAAFLPPVDAKDAEIQTKYDHLRQEGRFVQPASARLTVAYADLPELVKREAASVSDQDAQAYYEAHKSEARFAQLPPPTKSEPPAKPQRAAKATPPDKTAQPAPATQAGKPAPTAIPTPPATGTTSASAPAVATPTPPKPAAANPSTPVAKTPPTPPPPRPFAEVRAIIIAAIAQDRAEADAKGQATALDSAVDSGSLNGEKTPDTFIAAAQTIGMKIMSVSVEQPKSSDAQNAPRALVRVPNLGSLDEDGGIFRPSTQDGFVSSPISVDGPQKNVCLVRLDRARKPASRASTRCVARWSMPCSASAASTSSWLR